MLSAGGQGFTISFLANSPNGDDETLYSNYVGKVATVANNGWVINVNPQAIPIADYMDLTGVTVDTTLPRFLFIAIVLIGSPSSVPFGDTYLQRYACHRQAWR